MRLRMNIWWLILAAGLFRLFFAASIGLGVDETYMVAAGRDLQLSYFDHPPLAWWLVWAVHHLTGSLAPLVLRLPFIALFALSTWLMHELTARLYGARAGLWAAIAFNLSPVFVVSTGSWILPDGPLVAAMLAAAHCLAMGLVEPRQNRPWFWLAAGAFGGLALLAKYHGLFIFAGAFLFVLTSPPQRKWLATPWPYLGTALGLAIFSPVLIWNAEHHWVSFLFQGARSEVVGLSVTRVLRAIAGHALYLAPWVWVPLVVVAWRALRRGPADTRSWLLLCLACGPIILFSIVPLWSGGQILPHWAAPGYLMLFPLLGAAMAEAEATPRGRTRLTWWLAGSVAFLALAALLVASESRYAWLTQAIPSLASKGDPLRELVDWHDLKSALDARGISAGKGDFIIAPRWHEAAKAAYALDGALPVLCLSPDPREFDVLNHAGAHAGQIALIIGVHLTPAEIRSLYGAAFAQIEPSAPLIISHAGRPAIILTTYLAHGFRPTMLHLGWNK